ncbi:MAG TPA: hypothetical protein GX525_00720 [Bacilli bacterium]|nr:hypothetical protein [Bacilli bacterium]
MNIENCPRCGQLFQKVTRELCPNCLRDLDKKYEIIYRFIRKKENRKATIDEIEKATEVDKEDIYRIIRLGKINLEHFPSLGYPCETIGCTNKVTKGRLCSSCMESIQDDLNQISRENERELKRKEEEKARYQTYQTFDNF